jgi:hypothetical protein
LKIDKTKFKTKAGIPITQGLFLELEYSEYAFYSLKEEDCVHNGKKYPSIKLLYLEEVTSPVDGEYDFANKYFLNWKHWERICKNARIRSHIDEWREELEVKLRSKGIKQVIKQAEQGNYQASKWLAEGVFAKRKAGRPSKEDIERKTAQDAVLFDEYKQDIQRLNS